ncbi:MAG: M20/M25/M40 family metallo-hydrolase [Candidatus Helarchaeota archaeon]
MVQQEIELLKKSLEIPSISGNEGAFGDFLRDQMEKLGIPTYKDKVGNVIGEIGSGTPVILLSSHMDTVPGTVPVKLDQRNLYGRGAVDAKGSLLAMICATARFVKKMNQGKIFIGAIVEEETTIRGIKSLLDSIDHVDYAIFGEPSGVNRICVANKGRIHLQTVFKLMNGESHVSAADVENPIHKAIEFWNALKSRLMKPPFRGKTKYFSVEPNITLIKGGIATNILPDLCKFNLDLRFPSGLKPARIIQEVEEALTSVMIKTSIQIEHHYLSKIPGFRVQKDSKIVKLMKQAIQDVLQTEATFLRKAGTNFMVFLAEKYHIPVVSYGPGNPSLGHTSEEHINLDNYLKSIKVLERFIQLALK